MRERTLDDVNAEIQRLNDEREKIIKHEAELAAMGKDVILAEQIHRVMCRSNHIDQCGFYYDSWTEPFNQYSARAHFLKMARAIIDDGIDPDIAFRVMSHVR